MAEIQRAIALGFFDGVHIGHAALLNKTKERAAQIGAVTSVLTFDNHPDNFVFGKEMRLINSPAGRKELINRQFGIENVVFLHFDEKVMRVPWRSFIETLVRELRIRWIVVGHDFCFGYKGEGNPQRLREFCEEKGIGLDVISAVTDPGGIISSTRIRQLIENGQIEEANQLLGHPHFLSDTVHSGYHLGTKMGTPTINMFFPSGVIIPRFGVYATRVYLEDGTWYNAVTNVGVRPTVSQDNRVSVESYLLDYSGNLYGTEARVDFYSFLRPETKFADEDTLSAQIRADAENARSFMARIP